MPNSIELKLVIQTSTMNWTHCALTLVLPRLGAPAALRGAARSTRSKTSALASRAASAAAASASRSAVAVLLPSAMLRLLALGAWHAETQMARIDRRDVSTAAAAGEWPCRIVSKKLCVLKAGPGAICSRRSTPTRSARGVRRALAENLRTDAHMGGAEGDRRLEVRA